MITLITGTPGSGKTLRSIWWLVNEYMKTDKDTGFRRPIYTNINECSLEVEPLPDDWRDTPEGSVILIDEAQRIWPSTGRPGVSQNEQIRALETHRHTGHDFILVTQFPTLIDSHVRKLVGKHEHLRRALGGANASHVHSRNEVFDVKDKNDLKNCDHFVWQFDKKLFKFYKSASLHTVKWHFPKKLRKYVIALLILFIFLFFIIRQVFGSGGIFTGTGVSPDSNLSSTRIVSSNQSSVTSSVVSDLIDNEPLNYQGCVWSVDACMCFDEDFKRVQMQLEQCQQLVEQPLPIVINARGRR